MTATPETVLFRDAFGTLHRVQLTDHGMFISPGSALSQRLVRANDVLLVHKSVPRLASQRNQHLYAMLDNEIRAGSRLVQVFHKDYPCELPFLVGYNMDVEEPFVLLRAYAGEAAPDAVRRLDDRQRRMLQIGMLRALYCTSLAGVVHAALTLRHLRWTGAHVQLVDFESARLAADRWRLPAGPGTTPEHANGRGRPMCADDVWSAGAIIHELVMGAPMTDPMAQQQNHPERLRSLLDGVFQAPEHRPCPADLLRRMHAAVPQVNLADPEAILAEGRRQFEEAGRHKGGTAANPQTAELRQPGRGRLRRLLSGLTVVAAVAAMVRRA